MLTVSNNDLGTLRVSISNLHHLAMETFISSLMNHEKMEHFIVIFHYLARTNMAAARLRDQNMSIPDSGHHCLHFFIPFLIIK